VRNNGIFVILTLAFIITISAIGDEDASPSPSIDLAVEPITVPIEPNISHAALRNDFLMFDTLYKTADARGENVARWSELHRFWTWSMTDPVGGFYSQETHDRFARAYPGFAKFIEDYRIIDSNGNAFYPSAETRRFLLRNVGEQPVRQIAREVVPAPAPAPEKVPVKAAPVRQTRQAGAPVLHSEPLVVAPVPAPVPAPIKVAQAPAPVTTPPVRPEPVHPGVGRGIFLIIVGLIGIGVVTIMLHAPGEEPRNPHPGIT
jgi:hypothetical protein